MALSEILKKESILLELDAVDRYDAIRKMVGHLADKEIIDDNLRPAVEREVIEREKIMGTGLEHGVAVPHALIEELSCETAAFGRTVQPVDFSARDGRPCDLIFLILIPQEPIVPYVRRLSEIVRLLKNEDNRRKIREAESVEEIFEVFK